MSDSGPKDLPAYAARDIKAALLEAGASGTIYSLVMPESEAALAHVVDGGDLGRDSFFSIYHEPWTQKQDAMHEAYFEQWLDWSSPIVSIRAADFPFRYPTAGASEGIYKIMAEYAASARAEGREPVIHIFEGEYEGFPAYADALRMRIVRHDRGDWRSVPERMDGQPLFWISQPSAIDGGVWPHFEAFVSLLLDTRPEARIVPDLTYVGSVARPFRIDLDFANIPSVVISHSKPFGGYYHRVGGVFSRREIASLFGNKWFKNLQSLAWATEMMRRHAVFDLPRKYRPVQVEAARRVAAALGLTELTAADVLLLGIATPGDDMPPLLETVLRGSASERVIRLCLTPAMTCLIDPDMAPGTAPALLAAWDALDLDRRPDA
jgi:hypothetical protein